MKKGILSILIALVGFFFMYKYHLKMYEIQNNLITGKETRFIFIDDLISFTRLFKMVTISISLLSLYLGTIAILKKNKIGIVGIILSILLFIAVFIPFWKYFSQNEIPIVN
ncbi:hypothetical protein [Aquimarina litoralis]|uniref:hypothetical protein n=1 Tax=Aquimarina litoralis TaxID=584605 RepID=UPI001C55C1E5|nr:hypothetical protein [Aquimarina litoralis]MBW1298096.1 hypothetical protein [Aquimarina litoralis]